MSTTEQTPVTAALDLAGPRPGTAVHRPAGRAAAVLLPAGAVLAAVSTVFDPPSTEPEPRGMYVAYGADPAGADVAATVLHYGFLAIGLGLLLAAVAVGAGRGRVWAGIGGALGVLGFANLSGAVVTDWFAARMAAELGPDRALELATRVEGMPALTFGWMLPMVIGFVLGPVLLGVGLVRAGVVRRWVAALPVACAVLMAAAQGLGPAGFLVTLAVYLVFGLVAGRALWRAPAR